MKRDLAAARSGSSFSANEVAFLAELVAAIRGERDTSAVVRRREFRMFEAKVATMVRRQALVASERQATASRRAEQFAALEANVLKLARDQPNQTGLELAQNIAKQLKAEVRDVRRILRRRYPAMQPLRLTAAGQAVLDEYEQISGRGTRRVARYTVDKLAMKHRVPIEQALNMCWKARKCWKREPKEMGEAAE